MLIDKRGGSRRRGRLRLAALLAAVIVPAAGTVAATAPAAAAATSTFASITLNTANWAADTGYGAAAPGWYLDTRQVVHLQGGVRQVSPYGDASLIGTLPFDLGRSIYTIVHTFAGTYADIGILSNGQIRLIPPSSPSRPATSPTSPWTASRSTTSTCPPRSC